MPVKSLRRQFGKIYALNSAGNKCHTMATNEGALPARYRARAPVGVVVSS